jgi:peptide/nickel transport system ATP-binding protein
MSIDSPTPRSTTDRQAEPEPLLEVRGLEKHFEQGNGLFDRLVGDSSTVRAVDGVDLTIRAGETLAVVGESGCGKSTLGRTVLNLYEPTGGSVRYRGEELAGLSNSEMRPYRRDLQMIFQDPLASLNPRQTIGQILKAPMQVHGIGADDEERTELARELLERVGLRAGHVDRYPHQFSGGQQQRVGIARALALEPKLIIADEPVSALDVSVQAQILNLLNELQDDLGLSLLFIAHDLSVVRHIADRVAVMYLGKIVETAPVDELFENPSHPYTRSLLSAVPRIDPEKRTDRILLEGSVPSPLDPPSGCRFHTRCPVVVPPEGWRGTDEQFKAAFTFRTRVLSGEIDPDAVRKRLEAEGPTDDDAVAARIVDRSVSGEIRRLPEDAAAAIRDAASALARGEEDRAAVLVAEAFPSPCTRDAPRSAAAGPDHRAACHRVDADPA